MKEMSLEDAAQHVINNMIKVEDGCWRPSSSSYRIGNRNISASRLFLSVYKPSDAFSYNRPEIGRACGNMWCVNPEHLYYKSVWHRFWEKVDKKSDDECWNWTHAKDGGGYGCFIITHAPYTKEKAHRFSWLIHNGEIPKGMFVCHHCDNPGCVNPKHLFLGTNLDNMKDKMSKNRQQRLNGASNGMCKLSEKDVKEIVNLHNSGVSYRNLSKQFKIGNTQIGRIIRKESWRWIWE